MGAAPDPGAIGDFPGDIAAIATQFMNATVRVEMPNTNQVTVPFDPIGDTGGTSVPTVIRRGPARVQKIRRPLNIAAPNEWSSSHQIRVQMALDNTVPLVPKGAIIVVEDGGRETDLQELTYVVTMSVNSSWAALTTYEAVAEIVSRG
jgi:hypothetical protein